jgi:GNAT superfamily N-acetyltransferase
VGRSSIQIRYATADDVEAVAGLASELAHSFTFSRARFYDSYGALLHADDACLLLAADGDDVLGYVLGFTHATFYANGPVACVEEIFVQDRVRRRGIGAAMMRAFELWAVGRGCLLVALATRRAAPFYAALGYQESASYLRKLLTAPPQR